MKAYCQETNAKETLEETVSWMIQEGFESVAQPFFWRAHGAGDPQPLEPGKVLLWESVE